MKLKRPDRAMLNVANHAILLYGSISENPAISALCRHKAKDAKAQMVRVLRVLETVRDNTTLYE
ncbi:MAG: hypothetical protein ACYSWP_21185 [Planctomycetota bacterium]|jgi:hypothetical protein